MKNMITKKDLVYWNIMLVMIIIFLVVLFFGRDDELVEFFGFSGTIIGIILAMVALIYTFYQNITLGNASVKLEEFANRASDFSQNIHKLDKLDTISDDIGTTIEQLKESTNGSISAINSAIQQLGATVESEFQYQRDRIESGFNSFESLTQAYADNMKVADIGSDNRHKLYFNPSTVPIFVAIVVYTFISAAKEGKSASLYAILQWCYDHNVVTGKPSNGQSKDPTDKNISIFIAFLKFFRNNEWVSFKGKYEKGEIAHIDADFQKAILATIEDLNNESLADALPQFYVE